MKYYYNLLSQPSRALYIFLKLNNIPVEYKDVNLLNGDHLTDEFREINRFQKVPCIVDDDGWKLAESIAILRYLMSKYKNIPDHFYPSEIRARAAVDEYLEWQHLNTRLGCAIYFQIKKKIGPFAAISENPNEGALPIFKFLMESTLEAIETLWLRGKKFLCSDEISFADIIAACEIEQPRMTGYDIFENRPKLKEWYERVRAATNPHYDEAHVIVNKIIARSQKAKL
ncbi:hypothetical protein PVAND_016123 [Polypedilum vanderplanki]|uniref:Glutathione S-transferase n=1 Tax=Polypedilum vanderplanki TaxID=319348 RepID=A0A9J6BEJ2_POLVA|nr:hypothetical protein PVAND_016123 [Polypedilum vanderplanki]